MQALFQVTYEFFESSAEKGVAFSLSPKYSNRCSSDFLGPCPTFPCPHPDSSPRQHKMQSVTRWQLSCSHCRELGGNMLNVHVEHIGEIAVIECEGRIVRSESAFKLREAVNSQRASRTI